MVIHEIFTKQKMMRRVLISLVPIYMLAIYLFGWRVILLLGIVTSAGVLTEYLILNYIAREKARVSEAVLVSCSLFVLTLPPYTPFWVAILGIVFGVFFAKGIFGGFGKNVFNPALVGRCFIYISFPSYLVSQWTQPFSGFPGGLVRFSGGADAITSATPLGQLSQGIIGEPSALLLGTHPGSLGETSALLIMLAAAYLIYTNTASYKIMVSSLLSFLASATVIYLFGATAINPVVSVLAGGFLFATVFMATDPITAPKKDNAKLVYGALIGFLVVIIRYFANFTEGAMFAILIANTFVPLIERQLNHTQTREKVAS